MKFILHIILFILVFTSCTKISEIKKITPVGNEFQKYLAQYYLEFADSEARQFDWIDSEYFAKKARLAIYGKNTPPENPENWKIHQTFLPELNEARKNLIKFLNQDNINKIPQKLAIAQYYYDCWIEQQEENWQLLEIEKNKENFYIAINDIHNSIEEFVIVKTKKNEESNVKNVQKKDKSAHRKRQNKLKPKPIPAAPISKNLKNSDLQIIFKNFTKNITKNSKKNIDNIVSYLKHNKKTQVIINSYSISAKSEDENLKFSKERALLVKDKILKSGISKDNIMIFAFGNSQADKNMNNTKKEIEIYVGE